MWWKVWQWNLIFNHHSLFPFPSFPLVASFPHVAPFSHVASFPHVASFFRVACKSLPFSLLVVSSPLRCAPSPLPFFPWVAFSSSLFPCHLVWLPIFCFATAISCHPILIFPFFTTSFSLGDLLLFPLSSEPEKKFAVCKKSKKLPWDGQKNYLEMARPENKQQQVIQSKFMKLNGIMVRVSSWCDWYEWYDWWWEPLWTSSKSVTNPPIYTVQTTH